jgi:hypothetical protein
MAKPYLTEVRFDFRGGRNTTTSPDLLNPNELVDTTNARLDVLGAVMKRTGTRRMHTTAIGSGNPVKGIFQWDSPSGRQIVAISNGRLYHKTSEFGEFTEVIPGVGDEFSITRFAHFVAFRASSSGAPLVLFIASGGKLYKWDGTTLTRIDGVNGAPPSDLLAVYHIRLFGHNVNFKKNLFWSDLGNGEDWNTGTGTDGGSAMIDVLTGDEIIGLDSVGSSLGIFTKNAIARFTGLDNSNISIDQETSGISAEVGLVGETALVRIEQVVAFLSDRGPYFATEAGVSAIGQDIENDIDLLDRTVLSNSAFGHHRQRREGWLAVSRSVDSALNKSVFVYNYRVQNWCGPFTYPFGITSFSRYEDANGSEWIIAGCADGFVRHMDFGALDDILANGSGGSAYTMDIELAPFFFETGPTAVKAADSVYVQADLAASTALTPQVAFDAGSFVSLGALADVGSGVQSYRVDVPSTQQGKRMRLRFTDASSDIPILNGVLAKAFDYGDRY